MKKIICLSDMIRDWTEVFGRYNKGDFDNFFFEVRNIIESEGPVDIVDKKEVMKAILKTGVNLEDFSFQSSFYDMVRQVDQRTYQIKLK
jgi:hypothetical protein